MAFSNLPPQEKDAFFSLLDEYFSSRPDLLAQLAAKGSSSPPSAVHRAFSSGTPAAAAPALGRVAAASAALAAGREQGPDAAGTHARTGSLHKATPPAPGLVPTRKFGSDVDTSSPLNLLSSLRHSTAAKSAAPPPAAPAPAPALERKKFGYAPPPPRAPEPAPEQEQGEWAEALYDYDSGEPGDLALAAKQRVLVVDRTSEDWWTGEVDGRRGLFPGSYVRLL